MKTCRELASRMTVWQNQSFVLCSGTKRQRGIRRPCSYKGWTQACVRSLHTWASAPEMKLTTSSKALVSAPHPQPAMSSPPFPLHGRFLGAAQSPCRALHSVSLRSWWRKLPGTSLGSEDSLSWRLYLPSRLVSRGQVCNPLGSLGCLVSEVSS